MWQPYSEEIQRLHVTAESAIEKFHGTAQTTGVAIIIVSFLIALLLFFIFLGLVMLLITVNPDLERERKSLVTPIMRGVVQVATLGWQLFALGALTVSAVGSYAVLEPAWASGLLVVICVGCYGVYRSDLPPVPPPHRVGVRKGDEE